MRIAVLSDIHSNLVALDAVLSAIGTVDAVWHLGDVVGYGPEPDGVVARLSDLDALGVRGNHDAAGVGGPEIDWFNHDARRAMEWTKSVISDSTRAWLAGLPERRSEAGVTMVHGSPRDPTWEYITSVPVARANFEVLETRLGFFGHTHIPAAFREDDGRVEHISPLRGSELELGAGRFLVNPGSVGQPRDGDATASYLILDSEAWTCRWDRVDYDIGAVQAAMAECGLPPPLAVRLAFGL